MDCEKKLECIHAYLISKRENINKVLQDDANINNLIPMMFKLQEWNDINDYIHTIEHIMNVERD